MTFSTILVANRSEIAIRVMRAATELGKRTIAVYAAEDKLSLHRFKADEAYLIGEGLGPVGAYLSGEEMIRVARATGAEAIHPGYGFLSENPDFAEACADAGLTFIGPRPETMRLLGDKVRAREAAVAAGVPVVPATGPLPTDPDAITAMAAEVGYPLMLKASWGGGGRGMRPIHDPADLLELVDQGRREAQAAFGNGEVYLERLVERARHVEVQVVGDAHGRIVHLFERDCSVQRRNQKVVERAPAPYLDDDQRAHVCALALKLAEHAGYECAGTVEFLMDVDTDELYFIEVNPRVQVEHTVTEEVTGIDIVRAQIRIAEGADLAPALGLPADLDTTEAVQGAITLHGHALQCRITTEDPQNAFIPDYGRLTAYRGATGFGIRLDGGTAYSGAVITRFYDSLLEKVTARAQSPEDALARMRRALAEFRIRGVATNLPFLSNLLAHPDFRDGTYTTRFIDTHPELMASAEPRDRATKLLRHLARVTVNGHPDVAGRPLPARTAVPRPPAMPAAWPAPDRRPKAVLDADGPEALARWITAQPQALATDTTMRDAHQSLLATRFRTFDLLRAAPAYETHLPQLFSVECWGGATFDVAMRFLQESPWQRLAALRAAMPGTLLQMLLRASNAVGYTSYPDNVVEAFIHRAADAGIDVFRVFDSLNSTDNMVVAMQAVRATGKVCEAAICYTGDLLDPDRQRYDLTYFTDMARRLEDAGAHVLAVKDMAGLLKPAAATRLFTALRETVDLPLHLHTHDTSGIAGATVLAAVDAGVDVVDGAMDAMSGLTSQPNLGSIVEALRHTPRDTGIDPAAVRAISTYWGQVREQYRAFETELRSGASEVWVHEMPGGQYANLKAQARAMGLEDRWPEIAATYAEVNQMFGDIVKVTPSSKVVGDMALAMVSAGLTRQQVEDPDVDVAFPDSVVNMMQGYLGTPPGGFPPVLQAKVLAGAEPIDDRPGALMEPVDLDAARTALEEELEGRPVTDEELLSHLLYPRVFLDWMGTRREVGPVRVLPTHAFFYGMAPGDELTVELEPGKTLHILLSTVGEVDEAGERRVFFELNGQPRTIRVRDTSAAPTVAARPTADPSDHDQVGAPLPGVVATMVVEAGQVVEAGDLLMTIEAMKMETAIRAPHDGTVTSLPVEVGATVDAKDLLAVVAAG